MTAAPRVTVAMPVYNGAKTLPRAISSVLSQTSNDFELLVIDDGSSDESIAVIERFRDPRIRLLVHEQNRGLAATRNHLVEQSRGDYTAWLDQDDWAHPERLALQVSALDTAPSAALCGTWTKLVTEEQPVLHVQLINALVAKDFAASADIRATMPFRNTLRTSSLMLRTEIVRNNDLTFDEVFAPAEDYRMWAEISRFGDLIAIPRTLTKIYEYASGASSQGRERQIAGARRTRLELLDRLGFGLSEDEVAAHTFVTEGVLTTAAAPADATTDDYSRAAHWLDEIQNRNRELSAFAAPALQRACAERLVALIWACSRTDPAHTLRLIRGTRSSRGIPGWIIRFATSLFR